MSRDKNATAGRVAATALRQRKTVTRTLGCIGAYDLSRPGDLARLMKVLADWNVADRVAGESGTVKVYLRRVDAHE